MTDGDDSELIDLLCDEFEEQIREGDQPIMREFLDKVRQRSRDDLFRELLALESELLPTDQWQRRLEQHQQEFPECSEILDLYRGGGNATISRNPQVAPPKKSRHQIGPYKILQVIGEGGMGSVYMAQQEKPVKRRVALKVIKAGLDSKQVIARFEAERQALAMMDHPSIARILDAGTTENGQPFFAMELVKGIELNEYCDHHRVNIPDRLKIFCQICEAMQHAHQKGIIHRDLKPSNILVAEFNGKPIPKIIDFGLAKALEVTTELTDKTMFTEFGQVLGTLKYMSPEQAGLDSLDIDTRSDIYSLGVILYELLTGTTPLDNETIRGQALGKVLQLVQEYEAPRPSRKLTTETHALNTVTERRRIDLRQLTQVLADELDWIVMKAINKDRNRRYESGGAFADDVKRFLYNEPVLARPPSVVYQASKFIRKHRGIVGAAAAIVTVLVAGIIASSWFGYQAKIAADNEFRLRQIADSKSKELAKEQEKTKLALIDSDNQRKIAEKNLSRSNYLLALFYWDENRITDAFEAVNKIPLRFREIEWYLTHQKLDASLATFKGHLSTVTSIFPSDDWEFLVTGSADGTVKVWDLETRSLVKTLAGHTGRVTSVAVSQNGQLIASGSQDGTVRIWNLETEGQNRILFKSEEPIFHVEFSLDQQAILSLDGNIAGSFGGANLLSIKNVLRLTRLDNGRTRRSRQLLGTFAGKRFASDGLGNVYAIGPYSRDPEATALKQHISVFNSKLALQKRFVPPAVPGCLAVDPSGQRLAQCTSKEVTLWNLDTEEIERKLIGHEDEINCIAYSPDGILIATGSNDATIRIWNSRNGKLLRIFRGHAGPVNAIDFNSEGTLIASASSDKTCKLWDVTAGRHSSVIRAGQDVTKVAYTKNGNRMLGFSRDAISAWDTKTMQLSYQYALDSRIGCMAVHPDGSTVAIGNDQAIRLVDLSNGNLLRSYKSENKIASLTFASNGEKLAAFQIAKNLRDRSLILLNTSNLEHLFPPIQIKDDSIYGPTICFSADNKLILVGINSGNVDVFDAEEGSARHTFKAHSRLSCITVHPKMDLIFTASSEGNIKVWNSKSWELENEFQANIGGVDKLIIDSSGKRLFSIGDRYEPGSVMLWSIPHGELLDSWSDLGDSVTDLSVHPANTQVAMVQDNQLHLWRTTPHHVDSKQFSLWHAEQLNSLTDNEPFAMAFHLAFLLNRHPKSIVTRIRLLNIRENWLNDSVASRVAPSIASTMNQITQWPEHVSFLPWLWDKSQFPLVIDYARESAKDPDLNGIAISLLKELMKHDGIWYENYRTREILHALQMGNKNWHGALATIEDWELGIQRKKQNYGRLSKNGKSSLSWAMTSKAACQLELGRYDDAMSIATDTLKQDSLRNSNRYRLRGILALCRACKSNQFKDAESEIIRSFQQLKQLLPKTPSHLRWYSLMACRRVVKFYELWNKPQKVELWRSELKQLQVELQEIPK